MTSTSDTAYFSNVAAAGTALLTTFRRTGEGVSTPVSIATDGDRVYFVTAVDSGKAKRIAHTGTVTIAPCTVSGVVLGETVTGRARRRDDLQRARRWRLLRPTAQLFWSFLLYRLRGRPMGVYEIAPPA